MIRPNVRRRHIFVQVSSCSNNCIIPPLLFCSAIICMPFVHRSDTNHTKNLNKSIEHRSVFSAPQNVSASTATNWAQHAQLSHRKQGLATGRRRRLLLFATAWTQMESGSSASFTLLTAQISASCTQQWCSMRAKTSRRWCWSCVAHRRSLCASTRMTSGASRRAGTWSLPTNARGVSKPCDEPPALRVRSSNRQKNLIHRK